MSGVDFEGSFLVILGYEGVGIVESVGEGVIKLKVGKEGIWIIYFIILVYFYGEIICLINYIIYE